MKTSFNLILSASLTGILGFSFDLEKTNVGRFPATDKLSEKVEAKPEDRIKEIEKRLSEIERNITSYEKEQNDEKNPKKCEDEILALKKEQESLNKELSELKEQLAKASTPEEKVEEKIEKQEDQILCLKDTQPQILSTLFTQLIQQQQMLTTLMMQMQLNSFAQSLQSHYHSINVQSQPSHDRELLTLGYLNMSAAFWRSAYQTPSINNVYQYYGSGEQASSQVSPTFEKPSFNFERKELNEDFYQPQFGNFLDESTNLPFTAGVNLERPEITLE